MDLRLHAPPQGLSQLGTSFFGAQTKPSPKQFSSLHNPFYCDYVVGVIGFFKTSYPSLLILHQEVHTEACKVGMACLDISVLVKICYHKVLFIKFRVKFREMNFIFVFEIIFSLDRSHKLLDFS